MRIYLSEVQDLRNVITMAANNMTHTLVRNTSWLDTLHTDAHPLIEYLSQEAWFIQLMNIYPQHKKAAIKAYRMQIEAFDKVKAEDYDFLFAVIEREQCCMVDALDIMNSDKYEWLDGLDLEDVAYADAQDACVDDWLLEYVDLERLEQDLRMCEAYTEHDGGVLRRR